MHDFPDRKRHRGEDDASEEQMETESGLFGRRQAPHHKTESPTVQKNQQVVAEIRSTTARMPGERNDSNSVFVSNLAFSLENPEDKLKAAFESCGTVVQVRPVFAAKGAFRGYCYVQFEDELAAQEALKLDRQEVDGRPMFVSPCVDKSKNPDFKACAALKQAGSTPCFRDKQCILAFACTAKQYRVKLLTESFIICPLLLGFQVQHISGEAQNLYLGAAFQLHHRQAGGAV